MKILFFQIIGKSTLCPPSILLTSPAPPAPAPFIPPACLFLFTQLSNSPAFVVNIPPTVAPIPPNSVSPLPIFLAASIALFVLVICINSPTPSDATSAILFKNVSPYSLEKESVGKLSAWKANLIGFGAENPNSANFESKLSSVFEAFLADSREYIFIGLFPLDGIHGIISNTGIVFLFKLFPSARFPSGGNPITSRSLII